MNRGQARIVAIVVVVAMIIAVFAAAITGGDETATPDAALGSEAHRLSTVAPPAVSEGTIAGPHLQVTICNGVSCPVPDQGQVDQLGATIGADPRVADVEFVSAERAYELFLDVYADNEELIESVRPEDVPARFQVEVLVLESMPALAADLRALAGVADVVDLVAARP